MRSTYDPDGPRTLKRALYIRPPMVRARSSVALLTTLYGPRAKACALHATPRFRWPRLAGFPHPTFAWISAPSNRTSGEPRGVSAEARSAEVDVDRRLAIRVRFPLFVEEQGIALARTRIPY